MITPGKFVRFGESTLNHLALVLAAVDIPIPLTELFAATSKHFNGPGEFIYAMDVLYVLGAVEVDLNTKVVSRAR